jgi:putative hydrolase of the HAD superfamily
MTTAVWFALEGTLFEYDRSRQAIFEAAVPDPVPGALDTFTVGFTESVADADDPYRRAFERVVDRTAVDIDPAEAAMRYVDAERAATTVAEDTLAAVEQIADTHPVGVLGNGTEEVTRDRLADHGLESLVDELVVSSAVGVKKPERELFDTARDRLATETAVFVGSSYELDIEPAMEAGFDPVHVRGDGGPAASVDRTGSITILDGLGRAD